MRKVLIMVCMLAFIGVACSPSVQIVPTSTLATTIAPTAAPAAILENPPSCLEAELVYHAHLGKCSWLTVSRIQAKKIQM